MKNQIEQFLEQYNLFKKKNPSFNLKTFNFLDKEEVKKLKFDKSSPEISLESLKIYRRLAALPCSPEAAVALYYNGIKSVSSLAGMPKKKFLSRYMDCFSGYGKYTAKKEAELTYKKAASIAEQNFLTYIAVFQHKDPYYTNIVANNLSEATDQSFAHLPSYNELFNNGNYCVCPDCRSMLSPAAYFVDLMRLQNDYIETKDSNYALYKRRPDLWNIELSCSNTNDLVSKLKIVNRVLLNNSGLGEELSDSAKYEQLTQYKYPLNLPFNFALFEIGINLQANNESLYKIWTDFPNGNLYTDSGQQTTQITNRQRNIALSRIGIGPEQWQVISDATGDPASYYGFDEQAQYDTMKGDQQEFLKRLSLNYEQFETLLFEDLGDEEIGKKLYGKFFINCSASGETDLIPATLDEYKSTPVNNDKTDYSRINRFIRLAFSLGWNFTELDWALRTLSTRDTLEINDDILPYLAWIKQQKDNLKLSVNQLCGFLGVIKDFGNQSGKTFFESVFDNNDVPTHKAWRNEEGKYTQKWIVPSVESAAISATVKSDSDENKETQQALAASLKLNNSNLIKIGRALIEAGLGDPDSRTIDLTLENLSRMYRLSLLPQLTGYSINQAIVTYSLDPSVAGEDGLDLLKILAGANGMEAYNIITELCTTINLLKEYNVSPYQTQYWLTGETDDQNIRNRLPSNTEIQNTIIDVYNNLKPTSLTEEIFIQSLSSTPLSRDQIARIWQDVILQDCIDQGMVIKVDPDCTDLIEEGTELTTKEAKAINVLIDETLAYYYGLQHDAFNNVVSAAYNTDADSMGIVANWVFMYLPDIIIAGQTLNNQDAVNANRYSISGTSAETLIKQFRYIQSYVNWIEALGFRLPELELINTNPGRFNIDFTKAGDIDNLVIWLTFDNIQTLYKFRDLLLVKYDVDNQDTFEPGVDIYNDSRSIDNIYKQYLGYSVRKRLNIDSATLDNIINLADKNIADHDSDKAVSYSQLESLANALFVGIVAQNQNDRSPVKLLKNHLYNKQRSVLLPLVIDHLNNDLEGVEINNGRDLYNYLLIDVEVDAVVETSYIVEANSAVQLYINRCLNNLEPASVEDEVIDWWSWMDNYRIWSANREVFFYPENYIEPEIRKNKTNLFTNLENDLQQLNLNDEGQVASAFTKYVTGLAKIADLSIVSSTLYDQMQSDTDVAVKKLFLVGCTKTDPTEYYYLVATFIDLNGTGEYLPADWGQWLSIDVQMKPIGEVTCLLAFGGWAIFWVEKVPALDTDNQSSDGQQTQVDQITTYVSYLDNNKQWSVPQSILSVNDGTTKPVTDYDTTIYPSYFNSSQSLVIPYSYKIGGNKKTIFPSITTIDSLQYATKFALSNGDSSTSKGDDKFDPQVVTISPLVDKNFLSNFNYNQSNSSEITYSVLDTPGSASQNSVASLWFYGFTSERKTLILTVSGGDSTQVFIFIQNGLLDAQDNKGNSLLIDTPQQIVLDAWNFITLKIFSPEYNANDQYRIEVKLNNNNVPVGYSYFFQQIGITFGSDQNILPIQMQEILLFNKLLTDDQINNLYEHSKDHVTLYPDIKLNNNEVSKGAQNIKILSQPNWNIINYKKASFLRIPYPQEDDGSEIDERVIRLNSNAALKIEQALFLGGVPDLLSISTQRITEFPVSEVFPKGGPTILPSNGLDFYSGPMRKYWWELFFQAPFLIANQSKSQQDFATAGHWYRYIFNPTITNNNYATEDNAKNDKYWGFLPLRQEDNPTLKKELKEGQIENLVADTTDNSPQLFAYHYDPFDPQTIAALRPIAYQKTILMHYIDNLINWGDTLYSQNNYEAISEAETLYINAYNLLGNAPVNLGACDMPKNRDLQSLISNLAVDVGNNKINVGSIQQTQKGKNVVATIKEDTLCCIYKGVTHYSTDHQVIFSPTLIPDDNNNLYCVSMRGDNTANIQMIDVGAPNMWLPRGNLLLERLKYSPGAAIHGNRLFICIPDHYGFIRARFVDLPDENTNDQLSSGSRSFEVDILSSVNEFASKNGDGSCSIYAVWVNKKNCIATHVLWKISSDGVINIHQEVDSTIYAKTQAFTGAIDSGGTFIPGPIFGKTENDIFYIGAEDPNNIYYLDGSDENNQGVVVYSHSSKISQICNWVNGTIYFISDEKLYAESFAINKESLSNVPEFIIELEDNTGGNTNRSIGSNSPVNYIPNAYFGMPQNDKLLSYWELLDRRLYNIRHSLDMNGQKMQVALFAPAIDPMALVQQVGSGASLSQAVMQTNVNIPYYRFSSTLARAKEISGFVSGMGQALLSALTQKDAEALALLYNNNQQQLLALTQTVNENQLLAAQESLAALTLSKQNAKIRLDYYTKLIEGGLSSQEDSEIVLHSLALAGQAIVSIQRAALAIPFLLPNVFGFANGGMNYGEAAHSAIMAEDSLNQTYLTSASIAGMIGGFDRRAEEWELQKSLSANDMEQIEKQILAAKYQVTIAEQQIKILNTNIKQEQTVYNFLKQKFTNEQLYQWMAGKLSAMCFQGYQLAYSIAQQAQKAFGFELGIEFPQMLQSTYWNSNYNGLLSCEALSLDLQRIEQSYMDRNKRRFEISKTISLLKLDPVALNNLMQDGECEFELEEKDFEADYPTHYCRQIKSISITLPSVLPPYTNIHATLTQLSSKTLIKPDIEGVEYLNGLKQDMPSSVRGDLVSNQQIALSQGINDTGLFTINFADERYLPFEGTGAISKWTLAIPKDNNPDIDFNNLTDVIIELNYTALQGGDAFGTKVREKLTKLPYSGYYTYFIAGAFPDEWQGFANNHKQLKFNIDYKALARNRNKKAEINSLYMQFILTEGGIAEEINEFTLSGMINGSEFKMRFNRKDRDSKVMNVLLPVTNRELKQGLNECIINFPAELGNKTEQLISNLMLNISYTAKVNG